MVHGWRLSASLSPSAAAGAAPLPARGLLHAAFRSGGLPRRLAGAALAAAAAGATAAAATADDGLWGRWGGSLVRQARCSAAGRVQATASAAGGSGSEESAAPPQLSLLRIAGDGRCLFRSMAQGEHIAKQLDASSSSGGSGSAELLAPQAETARADELRQAVCDELLRRREELCFFIDEDYDTYVASMRRPHVWGGEPELAVAAHVLQRPIAVFTQRASRLALVSRYGEEEYSGRHEVLLFFHGAGHYDLLVDATAVKAPAPRSKL